MFLLFQLVPGKDTSQTPRHKEFTKNIIESIKEFIYLEENYVT
jgi:hypothetical protein